MLDCPALTVDLTVHLPLRLLYVRSFTTEVCQPMFSWLSSWTSSFAHHTREPLYFSSQSVAVVTIHLDCHLWRIVDCAGQCRCHFNKNLLPNSRSSWRSVSSADVSSPAKHFRGLNVEASCSERNHVKRIRVFEDVVEPLLWRPWWDENLWTTYNKRAVIGLPFELW